MNHESNAMDNPDVSQRYTVSLQTPLDETKAASVALRLAEKLNVSIGKMTRLLTGHPGALTRAVPHETALKLERLFTKLGVDVALEPVNTTIVPPPRLDLGKDLAATTATPATKQPLTSEANISSSSSAPLSKAAYIELDTSGMFHTDDTPTSASQPFPAASAALKSSRRSSFQLPLAILLVLILGIATVLGASYLLPGQNGLAGLLGAFPAPTNPQVAEDKDSIDTAIEAAELTPTDPEAQYDLAWRYANGINIEQSYEDAFRLLTQAAMANYSDAQYLLGLYYLYGHGVEADPTEAELWLSRAAEAGVAEAQYELGKLYAVGDVIPADSAEAAKWLLLAVDQGVENSAELLASLDTAPPIPTSTAPASTSPTELASNREARSKVTSLSIFDAVKEGKTGLISQVIEAGGDVNARDSYGQTPLMYAAGQTSEDVVLSLIEAGANIDARSDAGWTALMYAARDNPALVTTLLDAGADMTVENQDGQLAFDLALEHHPETAPSLFAGNN